MTDLGSYLITCPACQASNRVPGAKAGEQGKCGSCHSNLPALYVEPVTLTDETFSSFVQSFKGPVLAEFWAPW